MLAAAVLVLLFGGIGTALATLRPPVYESTSAIVLQQPEILRSSGVSVIIKLNQLRLHYVALIDTDQVTGPAARQLNLRRAQVAGAVSASVPEQSLLLYPTARARSPQMARRLARAVTASLVAYANDEQSSANIPTKDRLDLTVVDNATRVRKVAPTSGGVAVSAAFGAAAAVVTMAGLAQSTAIRRNLR